MIPEEYEVMADRFLGAPLDITTTRQCQRGNGDLLRYNDRTEEFSNMSREGYIVTYFRPDPDVHGQPSNLAYFYAECGR